MDNRKAKEIFSFSKLCGVASEKPSHSIHMTVTPNSQNLVTKEKP